MPWPQPAQILLFASHFFVIRNSCQELGLLGKEDPGKPSLQDPCLQAWASQKMAVSEGVGYKDGCGSNSDPGQDAMPSLTPFEDSSHICIPNVNHSPSLPLDTCGVSHPVCLELSSGSYNSALPSALHTLILPWGSLQAPFSLSLFFVCGGDSYHLIPVLCGGNFKECGS